MMLIIYFFLTLVRTVPRSNLMIWMETMQFEISTIEAT